MTAEDRPEVCPHCGADLQGEPIPEKYLHHNIPGDPFYDPNKPTCDESKARWERHFPGDERCFCLPYGEGVTHFRREIGVEHPGLYDGMLFYVCPDCGGAWHRFKTDTMRKRAQPFIDERNAQLGFTPFGHSI